MIRFGPVFRKQGLFANTDERTGGVTGSTSALGYNLDLQAPTLVPLSDGTVEASANSLSSRARSRLVHLDMVLKETSRDCKGLNVCDLRELRPLRPLPKHGGM